MICVACARFCGRVRYLRSRITAGLEIWQREDQELVQAAEIGLLQRCKLVELPVEVNTAVLRSDT